MRSGPVDLSWVELDPGWVPDFHRRVYEVTRTIRPGTTVTYGEISLRLDAPGSAQAVGQALGANPYRSWCPDRAPGRGVAR